MTGAALQRCWFLGVCQNDHGLLSRTTFGRRAVAWSEITGVDECPLLGESTRILLRRGAQRPVREPKPSRRKPHPKVRFHR